jgi:hypothetical protein
MFGAYNYKLHQGSHAESSEPLCRYVCNLITVEEDSGAEASDGCSENSDAQNAACAAVLLFL